IGRKRLYLRRKPLRIIVLPGVRALPHNLLGIYVPDRLAVTSLVCGPFCVSRLTFNFSSSPARVPSYLVTRVFPLNSILVSNETLLPSTLPFMISMSGG